MISGLVAAGGVGITVDEPINREFGALLLRYYLSGGQDQAIHRYLDARLYGGLFDLVAAVAERLTPALPWYVSRHILTVSAGAVGVLFTGLVAARLSGPATGALAGLLLLLHPRWFGHSLFNGKDIPFAAAYAASTFFLVELVRDRPWTRIGRWIGFGAAAGAALAIRAGALLLPACLAALVAANALGWCQPALHPRSRSVVPLGRGVVISSLLFLVVGIGFWPYLQSDTFRHVVEVAGSTSRFPWPGLVYFDGALRAPADIGRIYLPTWLAITMPVAVAAGLFLALFDLWRRRGGRPTLPWTALALTTVAGPFAVIASSAMLYNGLRHCLFVLPGLAVVAAAGWTALLSSSGTSRWARRLALLVLFASCSETVWWTLAAQRYAYTYFSPLVGGIRAASHRFETDYWWVSARPIAAQLERFADARNSSVPLRVHSPAWSLVQPFLSPQAHAILRVASDDPSDYDVRVLGSRALRERPELLEGHTVLHVERVVPGQVPYFALISPSTRHSQFPRASRRPRPKNRRRPRSTLRSRAVGGDN